MPRRTGHLTVTVDGDERDPTWKQIVGIYVGGHDLGNGDTFEIEGTAHEVVEMRRIMMENEAMALLVKVQKLE